ncbi:MAG: hypothetical protein M1820_005603 [Bogoriella megaspora]|nr:MAG: hypothetical protein M1820_005603 [Bogoriella megaspora]
MTSTVSPVPPNPINQAATTANPASSSAGGATSPLADGPAQAPTARSYANATKKTSSPPLIASSTPNPPVAVGGTGQIQHGYANSISPVNGKPAFEPAVPAVSRPPSIVSSGNIVNGAHEKFQPSDHGRKPSVTISAAGTSGQLPNGGPVGQANANSRPPIAFGSMNPQSSPAPAHSTPFHHQNANLGTPLSNPRITSPAHSPSPIPQPPASGGRPPSGLQGQGNGLSFGEFVTGPDGTIRPGSMQPGSLTPVTQPSHLRRESSQSSHSDMSNLAGFQQPGGRGRGSYGPGGYPAHMANSPNQPYGRPSPAQRPPSLGQYPVQGMPPQFNNNQYRGQSSPHIPQARMHMTGQPMHPQHMPPTPYGYPQQHLNPQQQVKPPFPSPEQNSAQQNDTTRQNGYLSQKSQQQSQKQKPRQFPQSSATNASTSNTRGQNKSSPSQQSPNSRAFSLLQPFPTPDFMADNSGYEQYLTYLKNQGFYGMPAQFDQNYAAMYQPYSMHPGMPYPGAPPSPRPMPGGQAPYMQPGQYAQGQNMSRSNSQVSEQRPSSSVGAQPVTPSIPPASQASSQTPSSSVTSPAPPTQFTRAKSKGIVIKDPNNGAVVDFKDQKVPSPAPVVSSTPTPPPPPKSASSSDTNHVRTESKSVKNDSDTKAAFQEQVRKSVEAEEKKRKEEAEREKKEKEEAEAKAAQEQKEKEEAEAKAAKEKEEAEKAAAEAEKAAAEAEKAKESAAKAKDDEAERKRKEDEEFEKMIAEMEAAEREREEKEQAYAAEKARQAEDAKKREAEAAANADEEMKRLEREAEEREAKRQQEKPVEENDDAKLFASLKKPTLGPGATASTEDSGAQTPASEKDDNLSMPPPAQPTPSKLQNVGKPRPANLKLETTKQVEPAQPTAGMQSLRSARFLQLQSEDPKYPEPYRSPNPALIQGTKRQGKQYDKDFLMQFQEVFKEKPTVDWDSKVKETLGGDSDSARPQSARTPSMGVRQPSGRGSIGVGGFPGGMGNFAQQAGGRTLPPGTTSEQRFNNSKGMLGMGAPLGQFNRPGSGVFPITGVAPAMSRTNSLQAQTPGSPRAGPGSSRGRENSRRDRMSKQPSKREEEAMAKQMPLTAGMELKPLEASGGGWKPTSVGKPGGAGLTDVSGHMPPDVVQRKVKAALNKMTPEKFDRIADQILEISAQSKDENDGRTLRQVIALTFEKACDEAHWASMYAKFCNRMLTTMSTDIKDDTVKDKHGNPVTGGALFRKYLLNRCQEEFERGWEVNLPDKPEGQSEEAAMLSDEYYIAAAAKRKGLGLIQFIGELYKLQMLTGRIMHECVMRLLNFQGMPDESAIESLVKLLRTVGATMESSDQTRPLVGSYFERIDAVMKMEGLPSRMYYMLLDTADLRRHGWNSKEDTKGPKTIQEIREEAQVAAQQAELERQRQQQQRGGGGGRPQFGRGDARSASGSGHMPPPEDYRKNTLGVDELRKLSNRGGTSRTASQAGATFGPSTLFSGRSNSGRKGLGPQLSAETSGNTSRTGTPPTQKDKKEDRQESVNAFSALADMDQGEGADDKAPSAANSPPTTKSKPSAPATEDKKEDGKPAES